MTTALHRTAWFRRLYRTPEKTMEVCAYNDGLEDAWRAAQRVTEAYRKAQEAHDAYFGHYTTPLADDSREAALRAAAEGQRLENAYNSAVGVLLGALTAHLGEEGGS